MGKADQQYADAADVLGTLGDAMWGARRARGLSLREVAEAIGVCPATVYRVECGKPCSITTAARALTWLASLPDA